MSVRPTFNYVTILKLLGVVFVGLHLPLAAIAFARFGMRSEQPADLITAAFLGTLLAAIVTLGVMWRMLSPARDRRATA